MKTDPASRFMHRARWRAVGEAVFLAVCFAVLVSSLLGAVRADARSLPVPQPILGWALDNIGQQHAQAPKPGSEPPITLSPQFRAMYLDQCARLEAIATWYDNRGDLISKHTAKLLRGVAAMNRGFLDRMEVDRVLLAYSDMKAFPNPPGFTWPR